MRFRISGTSNIADRPQTGQYFENHVFSDKSAIYHYEKYRESIEAYHQRTADVAVVETGVETGVKTFVIMAPDIFGLGTGPVNRYSIQVPAMMAAALKSGYVGVIGEGETRWDHVHVEDVADLYLILLKAVLSGKHIPEGKRGIYFAESGNHSHRERSAKLAKVMHEAGLLQEPAVRMLTLEEAAQQWAGGHVGRAELGFGSKYIHPDPLMK